MKRLFLFFLFAGILGVLLFAWQRSASSNTISADVTALQNVDSSQGFAQVDHPRTFTFPQDHGPHPEYQTEWWYYTGNLDTTDGRHFGYQLTFFRRAVTPTALPRASDWATNQIYFAHLAITDVKANDHFATERFERGAAGLAGASGDPYHVWLDNWEVGAIRATEASPSGKSPLLSPDGSRVRLHAEDGDHALDLTLASAKPPVLHGDQGLSQKSSVAGDASYYYSFTRLLTEGTISVNGQTFAVKGLSWMDHEFGTTELGPNAVGWDWFSIQLSDQREVMFFQIRQKDGSIEPLSGGTLVEPDGTSKHLTNDQVQLRVLSNWTSSKSGATYPARWSLTIPSANINLTLSPYVADQENRVSFTYWEGAVEIGGTSNGAPVQGSGYVEMTGYAPTR
jgi:predicted secreted hydrolase